MVFFVIKNLNFRHMAENLHLCKYLFVSSAQRSQCVRTWWWSSGLWGAWATSWGRTWAGSRIVSTATDGRWVPWRPQRRPAPWCAWCTRRRGRRTPLAAGRSWRWSRSSPDSCRGIWLADAGHGNACIPGVMAILKIQLFLFAVRLVKRSVVLLFKHLIK